ncbi:hypothetical protein AAF712_015553 [Marasmius tenuissimus]|uniref:G domain-containing protein n=1 Tax=Marasmius tenuissimus TaxID=585030 RepID=A0ABR2Z7Y1_9AGAR
MAKRRSVSSPVASEQAGGPTQRRKSNKGDHLLVMVMGGAGTEKTTFINNASGGRLVAGSELESCTKGVSPSPPFKVQGGEQVTLYDTPAFNDTCRGSVVVLETVTGFLVELYQLGQRLSGIIFLHRITDVRTTDQSARILNLFIKICGEQQLRNVLIVTTGWGVVAQSVGIACEEELRKTYFEPLLSKGAQIVRHEDNTPAGSYRIVEDFLNSKELGRPKPLQVQVELVDDGMRLSETKVGLEIALGLTEQIERYEQDFRALKERIQDIVPESGQISYKEMENKQQELKVKMKELEKELAKLKDAPAIGLARPRLRARRIRQLLACVLVTFLARDAEVEANSDSKLKTRQGTSTDTASRVPGYMISGDRDAAPRQCQCHRPTAVILQNRNHYGDVFTNSSAERVSRDAFYYGQHIPA